MPDWLVFILLTFLIAAALSVVFTRSLLYAVIIFGAFSLVMALLWENFNAPDIAITEAAVGVGSTVLMVAVVMRTRKKGA
ncbi:MAG TPA: DUF4040 domain-containing protein [Firmicutes bacterium]|nr:DUF4040 domain-containing protein [Bacillota bacterium]